MKNTKCGELLTLNKFFNRIEESAETFDDYLIILNKCHLRFNTKGMSYPITAVKIDIKNKEIEFYDEARE